MNGANILNLGGDRLIQVYGRREGLPYLTFKEREIESLAEEVSER